MRSIASPRLLAPLAVMAALLVSLVLFAQPVEAANFNIDATGATGAEARFTPNNQTVSMGDTVTFRFVNAGASGHTATAVNGAFNFPLTTTTTTGVWTPTAPGTYYFFCATHASPAQATEANVAANNVQVGKIVVQGAAQTTAATTQWQASLIAAEEVPPSASTSRGSFTATLDEAAGTLTWSLAVPRLTNATAAHLHVGPVGVNGPVVLNLFAAPAGAPAGAISVNGTARVADLAGPLAGNFAGFVAALKSNTIYANAHTTTLPGGEIRGQVVVPGTVIVPAAQAATPAPTTAAAPAPAKTGTAGLVSPSSQPAALFSLAALTLAVLAGARLATRRR